MENFHWEEYWDSIKKSLQKTYANLKEEDLQYKEGSESLLMNRIAQKLGVSGTQVNEVLFLHLICANNSADKKNGLSEFAADLKSRYYFPN